MLTLLNKGSHTLKCVDSIIHIGIAKGGRGKVEGLGRLVGSEHMPGWFVHFAAHISNVKKKMKNVGCPFKKGGGGGV